MSYLRKTRAIDLPAPCPVAEACGAKYELNKSEEFLQQPMLAMEYETK